MSVNSGYINYRVDPLPLTFPLHLGHDIWVSAIPPPHLPTSGQSFLPFFSELRWLPTDWLAEDPQPAARIPPHRVLPPFDIPILSSFTNLTHLLLTIILKGRISHLQIGSNWSALDSLFTSLNAFSKLLEVMVLKQTWRKKWSCSKRSSRKKSALQNPETTGPGNTRGSSSTRSSK